MIYTYFGFAADPCSDFRLGFNPCRMMNLGPIAVDRRLRARPDRSIKRDEERNVPPGRHIQEQRTRVKIGDCTEESKALHRIRLDSRYHGTCVLPQDEPRVLDCVLNPTLHPAGVMPSYYEWKLLQPNSLSNKRFPYKELHRNNFARSHLNMLGITRSPAGFK